MKIVNRRSFLKSSASAAGMLSIAGPLSSRMGQAQTSSPNLSIYTACSNVHALTAADWGTSNVNGQDYVNSGNAINALVTDWKANGFDQQTQPLWQRMTPSMLQIQNINQQAMLQQMQIYQPSCSADAVTMMLNWLCNQSDATKTSVLTAMQNGQTSNYFQSIVNLAPKAATAMAAVGAAQAQARQAGQIPSFRPTPEPPDGGYGCHDDDYAMGFAAVALSVLAVSVGGFAGIAGVLAGEYWGSVLGWGTVGAGVWAGVHLSLC